MLSKSLRKPIPSYPIKTGLDGTMGIADRITNEFCRYIGLYKGIDVLSSLLGKDDFKCSHCAALVRPKESLKHFYWISEKKFKKRHGSLVWYLDELTEDEEAKQYVRKHYNPNFLR